MTIPKIEVEYDDDDVDFSRLPDTDYKSMMRLIQEKKRYAAEKQKWLENRSAEEIEAGNESYKSLLVKCPDCLDVLGRKDLLGTQELDVIREHQEFCYHAQKARKE